MAGFEGGFPWENAGQPAQGGVATQSAPYDYTREQGQGQGGASVDPEFDPSQFNMGGDVEALHGADKIEKEASDRDYQAPAPGDYTFVVTGFFKAPERVEKSGWVGGQFAKVNPYKVGVKLGVKDRTNFSLIEWFELPPDDPTEARAWQVLNKKADGKTQDAGFMYRKLEHFVGRLGFDWQKGARMPQAAKNLGNWIGREINATVEAGRQQKDEHGQPKCDPSTGQPYPVKPGIKLFSFRPAQSTLAQSGPVRPPQAQAPAMPPTQGHAQAPAGHPAQPPQGYPQPQAPQGTPPGAMADSFARSGLGNI